MRGFGVWVCALLFAIGCAHPTAGGGGSKTTPPKVAVKTDCVADRPCHYRLSDTINDESVELAAAWIQSANKVKSSVFVLELNTPGGSVGAGFELVKEIENAEIPMVCMVDGRAASMGFYILQSCPMRVMTRRSTLMTHEPSISTPMGGPANDWRAMSDALAALREAMAWYCNRRLTTTLEEYHARTDGGLAWWFTWIDAKRFGAVDVVVDTVAEVLQELRNI